MKRYHLLIVGLLIITILLIIVGYKIKEKPSLIKEGDLAKIYSEYFSAVNSGDMNSTFSYQSKDLYSNLTSSEKKEVFDFLNSTLIRGLVSVQEIKKDNQGILIFETQDSTTVRAWSFKSENIKPIPNERLYGAIYFFKENGEWKINTTFIYAYIDPRPLIPCVEEEGVKCADNYGNIAYHCGHVKSKDECNQLSSGFDQYDCEMCFAGLNDDISLCRNERWQLYNDCLLNHYFNYHAEKTNCSMLTDINYREICEVQHRGDESWMFIDSDGDGLTNKQEAFFNTAMSLKDTDKDGKTDYDEIKSDSNPLGDGRLGDHLIIE